MTNKEILVTLDAKKMAVAMCEIISRAKWETEHIYYDDALCACAAKPSKKEHILKEITEWRIEEWLDSEIDEEFWKYRK